MLTDASFVFVADLVRRESAIVLGPGKEYLVEARLAPLARAAGCAEVSEYVTRLRARRDREAESLVVEALTTNETFWFRDSSPFLALADTVLPRLARSRAAEGRLRLWSAACASGQEPYSMAIVADEVVGERAMAPMSVEILASDISERMLARTREGRYSQLEINRGLPAAHLVRHFTRDGLSWVVSPRLRQMVTPRKLNLAAPLPPIGPFDVIFLRNALIYFDTATKRAILARVRGVLRPDGYLFLGGAETTLGVDDTWARVPVGPTIAYQPSRPTGAPGTAYLTPAEKGA